MQTPLESFLERVKNSKPAGNGYIALCPAHDDRQQSLSIGEEAPGGKVLLHCHAGCDVRSIVQAVGLEMKDLFPQALKRERRRREIVAVYDYTDEQGNILFQAVRFKPKSFVQRRPDPVKPGEWIWNLNGMTPVLYHLPEVIRAVERRDTVYVVEGEKDADSLRRLGLTGTCNPMGAGKWRDHYVKRLEGARVVVLPDNDEPGRRHAWDVARSLHGKADSVKILELPGLKEKGDVTDWLEAGGTREALEKLVTEAPEWEPGKEEQARSSSLGSWKYFDGRTFIPKRLAEEIMAKHRFRYAAERLWVYREGVYHPDGETLVEAEAKGFLGEAFRLNRATETYHYIRISSLAEDPEPDPLRINVLNGRLNWIDLELEPHDPNAFEIAQIPVRYDPEAKCPEFDRYLETTLDKGVIDLVEEIMGYCLIPDTRFEKAIMLTGSGSNGKSVFLDTLVALLGSESVANVPLQELEENRFRTAELYGRLANVFADLDSRALKSSSMFKTVVTGDSITAERKFGAPFRFRPYSRLIFSANKLPSSRDRTPAFYRRWLIIPFERTFQGDSADKMLRARLTAPEELSGILNRALRGLHRLFQNEAFTVPESVTKAMEAYREANDTVAAFLAECCVADPEASVPKKMFYEAYKNWCEEEGIADRYVAGQRRLRESLLSLMPNITEKRDGMYGPRQWGGIRLVSDNTPSRTFQHDWDRDSDSMH